MKKRIILYVSLSGAIFCGGTLASATNDEAIYDLNSHNIIESFELEDEGEVYNVTVIDDSFFSRVADKTYTISKNKSNSWSISYKVSIKNNKITSAHGGDFKASQGNFSNTSVSRSSDVLAIGKGAWKYRAATNTIQVKATINNKNLSIK